MHSHLWNAPGPSRGCDSRSLIKSTDLVAEHWSFSLFSIRYLFSLSRVQLQNSFRPRASTASLFFSYQIISFFWNIKKKYLAFFFSTGKSWSLSTFLSPTLYSLILNKSITKCRWPRILYSLIYFYPFCLLFSYCWSSSLLLLLISFVRRLGESRLRPIGAIDRIVPTHPLTRVEDREKKRKRRWTARKESSWALCTLWRDPRKEFVYWISFPSFYWSKVSTGTTGH